MTAQTSANLLSRANAIRTSTAGGAVTPSQVGGLMVDMIDSSLRAVDAAQYGFSTANTAAANTTIMQAIVNELGLLGGVPGKLFLLGIADCLDDA